MSERAIPSIHWADHTPGGPDAIPVVLYIKVTGDTAEADPLVTGDGQFIFEVGRDLGGAMLVELEGYVTTVGGSGTSVQLRNVTGAVDMLSTALTIDSGEKNSKDAGTQPVIDADNAGVEWGDHVSIDVDSAGSGAKGLGVILTFG